MVLPIHERLFTRSTVAKFSSRLPKFLFSHLLTAPMGLPSPNGSMFHHSPAVTPFSPTQSERRAVVAPYRSCIRATAFRSIHRIANWEKNSIRNTMLTTAKVATAKDRLPALPSRGVPSSKPMIPERSNPSLSRKNPTKSYLSSMISPQRSVSPMHGSKLPMMAGISATLYPIIVLAT